MKVMLEIHTISVDNSMTNLSASAVPLYIYGAERVYRYCADLYFKFVTSYEVRSTKNDVKECKPRVYYIICPLSRFPAGLTLLVRGSQISCST